MSALLLPAPLAFQPADFQAALLAWYTGAARPLPWRDTTDPYKIWLAETMLQQTTVATVIPYWQRFLVEFPTVGDLAAVDIQRVLHLWQGLGYYRRAHLLHACAGVVMRDFKGIFPNDLDGLLSLPGVGTYSAAAILATAFDKPASVLDGNVERVVARLFCIDAALPKGKPMYRAYADALASQEHPRLYANAIMELGATVCTPKNPACATCPVRGFCAAYPVGTVLEYPKKSAKKKLPHYTATAYVVADKKGRLMLHQRGTEGMLAGLWEVPTTTPEAMPLGWPKQLPFLLPATTRMGQVQHTFSHFKLTVHVCVSMRDKNNILQYIKKGDLPPISTLMRKVLAVLDAAV